MTTGTELRALVLAGGLGTRLRPLTDELPKCLVEIAGRPLLDHWLDALERASAAEVRVNNHHLPDVLRAYLHAADAARGLRVVESFEPELLGSAGTVAANRDLADGADAVVVVYGDNFSDVDLRRLVAFHRGHDDPMTMLLFHTPYPRSCGIAEVDADARVTSFVEKPENPASDLANAGVYVLDAEAYREVADMGAFDFGFDVLPRFVGRMRGFSWDGYHRDIGTPEALDRVRKDAPGVVAARERALR